MNAYGIFTVAAPPGFMLTPFTRTLPFASQSRFLMLLQTAQTQISYKSCLIMVYSVCLLKCDKSDPTLVDPTSNFFILYSNMKIYLYNNSWWVEPSMAIHDGKG